MGIGCRSLGPAQVFEEARHRHPDHTVWMRSATPLFVESLPEDFAFVAGVVRYWTKTPERNFLRWHRVHAGPYATQEIPHKLAWSNRLWAARTTGDTERIKAFLKKGSPVIALQSPADGFGAYAHYVMVVGYSEAEKVFLVWTAGRRPLLIPEKTFASDMQRAGNQWLLILPPEFAGVALTPEETFERGLFFENCGHWEKALRDYESATAGVSRAAAWLRMGILLVRQGRLDEAEAAYRKSIAAAPEKAQAYNNLAVLLADRPGRAEEAVALARNALALDPANPRVLDTLGYALYQHGKTREAADVLERARGRALWLTPEAQAEIAVHLIRAHIANGDIHLAREVLRDALRSAPNTVPNDLKELLK